ncbi:MAG TPA: hypothetical protein VGY56_00460 [Verrucomicrobiae bacterium]|nr:hypothetical protein [Verrucomicrobiae bacterium]
MTVRQYCATGESEWLRMRMKLWPQLSVETHRTEMTENSEPVL